MKRAGIAESRVAIVVQPLDARTPELTHNAGLALNPASVMKLLTTLAALDTFGPAHTFKTEVRLRGEVRDGVLDGDLILRGGGDPGLTLERFWLLLREIRAREIREIRGDLVIDNRLYDIEAVDPGAFDQAPLRPYNAHPAALLVNFNTLELRLAGDSAGGVRARLDPPPDERLIVLDNRLQASPRECGGGREPILPSREGARLTLTGSYATACGDRSIALNLLAPEQTVAAAFAVLWTQLGGSHAGGVRVLFQGGGEAEGRPLFEFESPPLADLARAINKHSNNVMAKMLLLNLGAGQDGAPATWEKGARAVRDWLAGHGLEFPELVIENGSGLSRVERLSADSLTRLLLLAQRLPVYHEFAASLPALGQEGTLRKRGNGGDLNGRAALKTGSLNGARNLAGYLLDRNGRRHALVMLVNDANAGAADRAQEALIAWAADPAARQN